MVNLGNNYFLGNQSYDFTVELVKEEILPSDDGVYLTDDYHKEIFARDIGMIYRIDIDREYCQEGCQEIGQISFGRAVEYKLIDYQRLD